MSEHGKIAEFLAYCIECYARANGISGADACGLFVRSGVLGYLERGYGVLHTMGEAWLLADIDGFLESRGIAT